MEMEKEKEKEKQLVVQVAGSRHAGRANDGRSKVWLIEKEVDEP